MSIKTYIMPMKLKPINPARVLLDISKERIRKTGSRKIMQSKTVLVIAWVMNRYFARSQGACSTQRAGRSSRQKPDTGMQMKIPKNRKNSPHIAEINIMVMHIGRKTLRTLLLLASVRYWNRMEILIAAVEMAYAWRERKPVCGSGDLISMLFSRHCYICMERGHSNVR